MADQSKIVWTNEALRLGDLKPWARNPRQIKGAQAERLQESFDTFGQVETIAIGPEGEIYNGHQRLKVLLQQHGPDFTVDVRRASRALTEKEREKLTVFLHKGAAGEWDFEMLESEFDRNDLLGWGFEESELQWESEPAEGEPGAVPESEVRGTVRNHHYLPGCDRTGADLR